MKRFALLMCLACSPAFAGQPYNYNLPQSNPFEALKQGIELGKKVSDKNATPTYGETGLPSNCRAYVQYAIDSYKQGLYNADETMQAIERNCGKDGWLWQ